MAILFDKYHGIGNDFLVVETEDARHVSVERAMELCDRHYGVGGDGVLLVLPPTTASAKARMRVINADGSEPEMCGNGLRCVALHLSRKEGTQTSSFVVDTGAGALRCDVEREGDRAMVGTEIGRGTPLGTLHHDLLRENFEFSRIQTGNPHAICFREPISSETLDLLGPSVSARIDGGANVEVATVLSPTDIRVDVWERGVGRTLACGTGAAATVIASVLAQKSPYNQPVRVKLPGGDLHITVDENLKAYLRGPAEWIYSGKIAR
jgi:diaminopimelate epimerase